MTGRGDGRRAGAYNGRAARTAGINAQAGGTALLRRQVGRCLAALRYEAGLSQDVAADKLRRGNSTLWRIEAGDPRVRWTEADMSAMCRLYRADDETRERLLALAAEIDRPSGGRWWHDGLAGLPIDADPYPVFEQSATLIRCYGQATLPDLLQTPGYAEALLRCPAGLRSDDDIAARLDQLAARQRHLLTHPHPPAVQAIVGEGALRRTVGNDATARAQLDHLRALAIRPGISVRVLPLAGGAHAGMTNPFTLLRFAAATTVPGRRPAGSGLVRLDTLTGTMHLDQPAHVVAYERVWYDLAARAQPIPDGNGSAK
ncbi:helix-turn-helix transcriptional regulator [Solwaraspora sp. WMMA2056]|uniref:helix-turn-helix domain-containing protein n=1 Tax=Solwaraspora sp. WMMA2056 TaxID=3015161 RepID=UPI00259B1D03|nr:helix-turn-helix transcriptional regulator [Solwaraspora sp. WMMA2056]WJK39332.1 helix-turn-helix transcriptional regulator [Solwaraspora sp. WMMA2056]